MKKEIVARFKLMTIVCILLGALFLGIGFHKRHVYESSEYYWSTPKNAYVGGDAYNYIINGNYFTGYSTIGMGFLIISAITATQAGVILATRPESEENT